MDITVVSADVADVGDEWSAHSDADIHGSSEVISEYKDNTENMQMLIDEQTQSIILRDPASDESETIYLPQQKMSLISLLMAWHCCI